MWYKWYISVRAIDRRGSLEAESEEDAVRQVRKKLDSAVSDQLCTFVIKRRNEVRL